MLRARSGTYRSPPVCGVLRMLLLTRMFQACVQYCGFLCGAVPCVIVVVLGFCGCATFRGAVGVDLKQWKGNGIEQKKKERQNKPRNMTT
jgi:hypothetical protein